MKMDKKNENSNINLVLIKKIGKLVINTQFNKKKIKDFLNKELI